jgi:hypothetical protein
MENTFSRETSETTVRKRRKSTLPAAEKAIPPGHKKQIKESCFWIAFRLSAGKIAKTQRKEKVFFHDSSYPSMRCWISSTAGRIVVYELLERTD